MTAVFPIALYLPGRDKGSVENIYDSFEMVSNSLAIQVANKIKVVLTAFMLVNGCFGDTSRTRS
ncbi:unnamed protein product, partial [Choristocarpus tenellus]